MKGYYRYPKRNPIKDYFPLPNELFTLDLSAGEIAVYGYLMRCEDRDTHRCHPSYRTIGRAVNLSPNTVRKHVRGLEEKRLIVTEHTTVVTRSGEKRNGTLLYNLRPIEEAVRFHLEQLMGKAEEESQRRKIQTKLAGLEHKRSGGPLPGHIPDVQWELPT